MVDWEQVVADFEAHLLRDDRTSHGTQHLLRRLAELRVEHRIDQHAEERALRRFGDAAIDVLVGRLPGPSATAGPLSPTDPLDGAADGLGRAHPITPTGRDACPLPHPTVT